MEVAGNMFTPIIGLKLPVVKARVPKNKNAMMARLCHTEIVPVGHKKKAGRKNLIIVCQKYHLVAVSH